MFNNENDFKELVDRLDIDAEPYPEHRHKLRSQMLSTFTGWHQEAQRQTLWRRIMKGPIPKLAAAAVIVVAVLVGIHQLGSVFFAGTVTFADVLDQIRTFRPYVYTSTVQYEGKPDVTRRMMISSLTRRREAYPDGYVQIFDLSQRPIKMLALHPDKKLAIEKTSPDIGPAGNLDLLRHLSAFENMPDRFAVEDLGVRQVEGRTAKGFHKPGEKNDWTIWADARTGLPIRIELVHPRTRQKIIMSELEFDVDFDQSLFSLTAPEGYTVKKIVAPAEQDLIEGLRAVAKFLGGEFPPVFEFKGLRKILGDHIERNNLSPSEEQMKILSEKLLPATRYVGRMKATQNRFNLRYVGEGVKLGDADSPILWYRPQGSITYHVIYGDLSVHDVAQENLPQQGVETAKLVALDIKLPKPMFVGTPQDTRVKNLEKPTGKPRPPFYAPEATKNVAYEKPISSTDEEPIIGELEMITDGDKEAADGSYVELGPLKQNITIDLGAEQNIYAIVMWHYHKQARVYFDVVVQVAKDPDFIDAQTLFNNDIDNSAGFGVGKDKHYTETNEGRLIDAKGVQARYVRLCSNGNNNNDLNHYIEVEVYGKPIE